MENFWRGEEKKWKIFGKMERKSGEERSGDWISCTPFERSMSCLSGGGFRGRCQRCAFEKAKRYREWAVERDGERRGGFSRDKGRGEEGGGWRREKRRSCQESSR